jgi:hypothetical protein
MQHYEMLQAKILDLEARLSQVGSITSPTSLPASPFLFLPPFPSSPNASNTFLVLSQRDLYLQRAVRDTGQIQAIEVDILESKWKKIVASKVSCCKKILY